MNSAFIYPSGKSHSDFHYKTFVPKFLDEANVENVTNAKKLCGEDNQECIFDLVFTENEAVANNTRQLEAQATTGQVIIENDIPTITGNSTVNASIGDRVSVRANASDDGPITYKLLYNTANATSTVQADNSTIISFELKNDDPVSISIVAEDDSKVQSPALDIEINLCSGCSNNGNCDFDKQKADNRSTPKYKYSACICNAYWQGENCQTDFDGCASRPCSPLRNCTDNPAPIHEKLNRAYNCSACPTGYTDGVVDTSKCIDINECNTSAHGCAQNCINTDGSYYCACNLTFRLHLNGKDCQDINECSEGISRCDQDCNNTYGGYICTCKSGYTYNISQSKCVKDKEIEACKTKNCSLADGCTTDEYGNATCFCRAGYSLSVEGSCKDINECTQKICPQGCENNNGSFKCTCFSGYSLGNDRISCIPCTYPFYGANCSYTCTCGRGAEKCDPVKGCVCATGWTGSNCDNDVNECINDPNICNNTLKSCINTIGSYTCTCISGYEAINNTCKDIDECTDPTLNICEQICTNTQGGYTCRCRSGYNVDEQNKTKCKDIDECVTGQSGCEQVCENSVGRFSCSCYYGYKLQDDRKTCIIDGNPCKTYGDLNCSQICLVDLVNKTAVCGCIQGFKLDNQSCIDINECTDFNGTLNMCSIKGNCKNTNGAYICSCDTGFKLENDQRTCAACDKFHYGINCSEECKCGIGSDQCDKVTGCVCKTGWNGSKCDTDKDECSNVSTCIGENVYCRNTPGSYQCLCKPGYENVSGLCQDINECTSNSINDCEQICNNTNGSYICSCQSGFLKNGSKCSDINECNGTKVCSQTCTNTPGNYRCSCSDGFILNTTDRRTCFDVDECKRDPKPCSDTCTNTIGSYICSCLPGKELSTDGSTCFDINECSNITCGNNATCINTIGSYLCNCTSGWNGKNCTDAAKHSETIFLKFGFSFPESESLNDNNTYKKYVIAVNVTIWKYFQSKLGAEFDSIEIINITNGSLNVEFRVITQNTDKAKSLLIKHVVDAYKNNFTINNVSVSVVSALIGNKTVNKDSDMCILYATLIQPCPYDHTCIIEENGPVCRLNYNNPQDAFDLIVGLGVGIPLGIIFILIVIVLVIYCRKSRQKVDLSENSSQDERSRVTLHGFMSYGMPTRMSSLPRYNPFALHSKSNFDAAYDNPQYEMSTSAGHRLSRFHPDTEHERRTYREDDNKQQESNFSWDFILNTLDPDEKYSIKRPRTDISPNPVYGTNLMQFEPAPFNSEADAPPTEATEMIQTLADV